MSIRVAFLNRGRETHPGGDIIALDETMAALRRLGVECEETGWDADRIASGNFDLCHQFHVNFDWSWGNYQAIQKAGKKYVLTPIYYPDLLSGITQDQLLEMLDHSSLLTPFSHREVGNLWPFKSYIPGLRVIPNGTSRDFHTRPEDNKTIWVRHSVITVCAREGDKNSENVQRACSLAGLRYKNIIGRPREEMADTYRTSRVFVNASESERMSLTIGEALCAGCRVLATKENRGNEWYGQGLYTFDPKESVEVLAERIRTAYECSDYDWEWSPNIRARKLTWDLTAAMLKQVYEEVLAQ